MCCQIAVMFGRVALALAGATVRKTTREELGAGAGATAGSCYRYVRPTSQVRLAACSRTLTLVLAGRVHQTFATAALPCASLKKACPWCES